MAAGAKPQGPAELRIEDLTVAYGRRSPAVRGLSAVVPAGSTLALLGANGAGKTTVMRAITGLLGSHGGRVVSGSVFLDGVDVTRAAPAQRVRMGMAQTMEGRRVFAELSVEDNLRAGAWTRRGKAAVADELAAVFARFPEIADRRGDKAGYLSGGQQQMLAIGRALMARPRLLLMDEPSLGLAPKLVDRVAEIVEEISAEGTTVVLIEQNVAMGLAVSDHAIALETGSVALEGDTAMLARDDRIRAAYFGGRLDVADV
ncbi:ABC transporter ATP-binding protein [Streptomyces chlorus]|uniref:ABC transporter ATP-binding protein n=1 Tax=Streptomyces chlorus TaxID=887452 RepID=A0ABW1E198_9ACTN